MAVPMYRLPLPERCGASSTENVNVTRRGLSKGDEEIEYWAKLVNLAAQVLSCRRPAYLSHLDRRQHFDDSAREIGSPGNCSRRAKTLIRLSETSSP